MGFKYEFEFKLVDKNSGEEFFKGNKVLLELVNGEIVSGYLNAADCISLNLDRRNNTEKYDFEEIETISKVIELE